MTDDLANITAGDPARERVLRAHLQQLAGGGTDPTLREMARAVLTGELTLRQAVDSDTYATALTGAFDAFWTRYRTMSPQERDQLAVLGREYIEATHSGIRPSGCL